MPIDKETATLIAAALAALVAIINTFWTGLRQTKLEREKWDRARNDESEKWKLLRQDEADKAVRLALAEVARLLASGAQAISWLTWKGVHAPDLITTRDFDTYNKTINALLPQIVGAHLLLVALDETTDETINPLVGGLYGLDQEVGKAGILFVKSSSEGIAALIACNTASDNYFRSLHERFKNVLGENRSLVSVRSPLAS